ncbi:MAG: hypothetical protein J1D77_08405 [Muribaculaceae bacterium]|nr:hypothetical protein [Muribaculaceae bacterium]
MVNSKTISKIIESNLLAASPSKLALELGYAGRATLNRLRNCMAGEEAIKEFCHRVVEIIGLHKDDIETVGRLIDLKEEFTCQMQSEKGELSPSLKLKIAYSFIEDDYAVFSDQYRQLSLNKWLLLKGHESEMFFYMLALFLLEDETGSFYRKERDIEEKYQRVLMPLQKHLEERYPRHTIGNGLSTELLDTPLAKLAYPCFLTAIRLGGILLKGYVSDYSDAENHDLIIKIQGLPDRSFWDEGEDRKEITFLKYVPVNDRGNGYYEYFHYNLQTGKTLNEVRLYFYGERNMGFFLKKERKLMFGHYFFDGENLKVELKPQRDLTLEYTWKRLLPENSRQVREVDRLFTDSYLNNVTYESMGLQLSCGILVTEVLVTKTRVILITAERDRYSVSRDKFNWLRNITPDNLPVIYRDVYESRIYAEWKEFGGRIPLDEFTKTSKAK